MDLARDARALRFPGGLEPGGEVAQLLAVAVQLLLRPPPLGDVLDHPDEQAWLALLARQGGDRDLDPDRRPVLAAVPFFQGERRPFPLRQLGHELPVPRKVLRVRDVSVRKGLQLLVAVADHPLKHFIRPDEARVEPRDRDADRRLLECGAEQCFPFPQGLLGAPALGQVPGDLGEPEQ